LCVFCMAIWHTFNGERRLTHWYGRNSLTTRRCTLNTTTTLPYHSISSIKTHSISQWALASFHSASAFHTVHITFRAHHISTVFSHHHLVVPVSISPPHFFHTSAFTQHSIFQHATHTGGFTFHASNIIPSFHQ